MDAEFNRACKPNWKSLLAGFMSIVAGCSFALAEERASSETLLNRAAQCISTRDFDCAIAATSTILDGNRYTSDAYLMRAEAFCRTQRPASAISDLRRILDTHPDNLRAWELMYEAYLQLRQHEDASACLRQVIKFTKEERRRIEAKLQLRFLEKSIVSDETMALGYPQLEKWVNGLETRLDNRSVAIDKVQSNSPSAEDSIAKKIEEAQLAEKNMNYPLAIKLYEEVLKKTPTDANLYHDLGVMYEIIQEIPRAIKCYERAVEINSNDVESMLALADLNAITLNDSKKALYWYALAIKTEPVPSKKKIIADRIKKIIVHK
jgi:tetratricopeptide (TPR) repeat protein